MVYSLDHNSKVVSWYQTMGGLYGSGHLSPQHTPSRFLKPTYPGLLNSLKKGNFWLFWTINKSSKTTEWVLGPNDEGVVLTVLN